MSVSRIGNIYLAFPRFGSLFVLRCTLRVDTMPVLAVVLASKRLPVSRYVALTMDKYKINRTEH